ncbi:hypothetical protein H9Q69_002335 [Fusarium xylarioides]|uniref:GPI anchored serine-rich protein n=1 Tax=Fusarium phyllophilum TaxID=47803 RepID=A0A8H5NGH3_9HYPO|nr:hypothetical protein FPHYL_5130 [Fusarium phyllophilum]KAG5749643.1 hypothetical protein H9Q70_007695 [Fusarium xylarioides]KAG5778402.1 hypothetical protein H9Q73_007914 [Fusarium xylarioides]KAG5798666.1 hypothetical protein H9Q69_002335 [Fusarium xylarioides]KAG5816405.1 hypothetical protein H9Q71_002379 [Fusarium xylarioides]
MQFSSIMIAAAGASVAAAQDYAPPAAGLDTTTLTSTTTRVITLTQCNPTVTDCPLRTTTSTEVVVTTSTAAPEVPTTTSVYVPPTTSVYEPVVNTTSHELPTIISTPTISTTKKAPSAKTTFYPAGNTTTKAGPTAPGSYTTTKLPVPGSSTDVPGNPGYEAPSPSTVPTAGASGLIASSGFVGAAMVAALVALF